MPLQATHETPLTRSDARSDDHCREVAFRGQSVVIARRVAGIAMRVRVPLASYRGLALWLAEEGQAGAVHKLELVHRDPDLSIPLFEAEDATAAAVEWDAWAQSLSLPRLFGCAPGQLEPTPTSAATLPLPRRRGSLVGRRRTRFSRRRKIGALARLATAYGDEREIISYE
jgi:hypothetical protein